MQKLVTASEMREIDRRTIEEYKIPGIILMERAGQSVFKFIKNKFISPDNKLFYIFCGKGNNGGDGFVVARLLSRSNAKVKVFLCAKSNEIRGDAKKNFDLLSQMNVDIIEIPKNTGISLLQGEEKPDLIIDALLGTGATGEVEGILKDIIEYINSLQVPVISIDIPSGLNADTGKILGCCVKATYTVTMGLPKVGLFVYPGASYSGEITIADLGFPEELTKSPQIKTHLIDECYVKSCIKPRDKEAHKGTFGRVLILAGSVGYTGAAYLAAQSCARAGAGLVTLGIPEGLNHIMEVKLTEVMTLPLPQTEDGTYGAKSVSPALNFLKNCNAVAIGPGISNTKSVSIFVKELIKKINLPCVVDADACNVLAKETSVLHKTSAPLILTPHPGELSRLINIPVKDIQENRIEIAKYSAKELNCILVLKGARTVVADKFGNAFINPTGNPCMASGGVGDVLTGVITALLAQGLSPLDAALCGVYIHGKAGDIVCEKMGEIGVIATDILEHLPYTFKEIMG